MSGRSEPTDQGLVNVAREAVRESAGTGLFTSRGSQRLGWAHATFADFLAAEWVVANDLTWAQAKPLFLGPDGRCWPQTRLAASWAVAIAPERFAGLVAADPAAFQGEVELPGDALRAAVVSGLIATASRLSPPAFSRPNYSRLQHPQIADQIRPHLRDPDHDKRWLAFTLAEECAPRELGDELTAIAFSQAAPQEDREAAAWALSRIHKTHPIEALRRLSVDPKARGDDPSDDLKGIGLSASWPEMVSTAEVFEALTPVCRQHYYGAYRSFIHRFCAELGPGDVDAGLNWLEDLSGPSEDSDLARVANRVFLLAAARPQDDRVVEAFARLVFARMDQYGGLLFPDVSDGEPPDPFVDPGLRRAVALAVLAREPADVAVAQLLDWRPGSLRVVRREDLGWLVDQYELAGPGARRHFGRLFTAALNFDVPEDRRLVFDLPEEHPLFVDVVSELFAPIVLDSERARTLRRDWEAFPRRPALPESPAAVVDDAVNGGIESLLDRFDNGEAYGFWHAVRWLSVKPGSRHIGDEFNPDVTRMMRWAVLPDRLRARFVDAAETYLFSFPCEPERWLRMPGTLYHPAEAGYRAMALLHRLDPVRLARLPTERWIEWAPVLAAVSTATVNGASWDQKRQLLELAGPGVMGAVRSALLARVEAAIAHGRLPLVENEAGYLWDDSVASAYLHLAPTAPREAQLELVNTVARNDFGRLQPVLHGWIEGAAHDDRQSVAAAVLLELDLDASWPVLKAFLSADLERAQEVLGGAGNTHRRAERRDRLSSSVAADLYLWLRANFSPDSDPRTEGAHWVGGREQIGQWRDLILGNLAERGTADAVEAIRAISAAHPTLVRMLAASEDTLRRNQWVPTPILRLLLLAADRRRRVVCDSAELSEATASALVEIQSHLIGSTPRSHYLWDTHSGRPKTEDEISDYIRNELERGLANGGIIVNREVQIRRSYVSGVGERTDLLVEAGAPPGILVRPISVPVEVKGAWHGALRTAMSDQLVDQYMRDLGSTHGIYVVVWPDLASWTDSGDSRRQTVGTRHRAAIKAELDEQARELAQRAANVTVIHLDISYRRPT